MNFVVAPNLAGLGDVAGLGRVNAVQYAHAFAVLGILAHGDIDAVLPKHWRGVDFARAFGGGIFVGLAVFVGFVLGRVAIEFPNRFQERTVAVLHGRGIE